MKTNEQLLSGLEVLQSWIREGERPPMGETLDFYLSEAETGRAVFSSTPTPRLFSPFGRVHGGYAATLLDSACACAAHSTLGPGQAYATVELKVAYHRPLLADSGPLRAEGKVLSAGKRVIFTEGQLRDAQGKLYASATSTLMVVEDRNEK